MLGKTHLAFGLGLTSCGIYLLETFHQPLLSPQNLALFYSAVGIGTLLPDIDEPQSIIGKKTMGISNFIKFIFGHRGFTHSLCFVLFFGYFIVYTPFFRNLANISNYGIDSRLPFAFSWGYDDAKWRAFIDAI